MAKDGYKRVTDRRMKDAGEIDFRNKVIRVNPTKLNQGGVADSVMHEELHRKHPKLTEKQIRKLTKKRLRKVSMDELGNMLKRFEEKRKTKSKKKRKHYKD